ncbi:putative threonine synthase Thr4 [Cladochytrium replicatum]|nr:putative threonine synthase Thr4 [Cladochytrium replicatum]
MRYSSTRGQSKDLSFEDAVFEGLAPDGGLYIPNSIPQIPLTDLVSWADLPFPELAFRIFRPYVAVEEIPDADLLDILQRSFATFSHADVTPVVKLPNVNSQTDEGNTNFNNLYMLELFHGPTFAFKDVALQVLGNLFEYLLARKNRKAREQAGNPADFKDPHWITVLGATSGDTGGAAIYGLRGKKNVSVYILHPKGRISSVQELQMTTVTDSNVFNVAVEGSFDDCQEIVKTLFSDQAFRTKYNLAAINSINWARILTQITYYFHSFFQLLKRHVKVPFQTTPSYAVLTKVRYCVPTGNFGDILAGYYAMRMGLPIEKLVIATNSNDILDRFMKTGVYSKSPKETANGHANGVSAEAEVKQTLSPAMDILVSSNFERFAWYLARGDGRTAADAPSPSSQSANDIAAKASRSVASWMASLKTTGSFSMDDETLRRARQVFTSFAVSDADTLEAITRYYHHQFNPSESASARGEISGAPTTVAPQVHSDAPHYVLDPHTAVGVIAAERLLRDPSANVGAVHTICLSTASPGKFPEAVLDAINSPNRVPGYSAQHGFVPIKYEDFAPKELVDLKGLEKRCIDVKTVSNVPGLVESGVKEGPVAVKWGQKGVRKVIEERVQV